MLKIFRLEYRYLHDNRELNNSKNEQAVFSDTDDEALLPSRNCYKANIALSRLLIDLMQYFKRRIINNE